MIVVGVDKSDVSKEALRFALHEASMRGTRLRAVHAWESHAIPVTGPGVVAAYDPETAHEAAARLLVEIVQAVVGGRADQVERVTAEGRAGEVILDNAQDAEMIVVGTRAHGSLAELFLGSVSHHVVRHSRCPVVVVPPVRS